MCLAAILLLRNILKCVQYDALLLILSTSLYRLTTIYFSLGKISHMCIGMLYFNWLDIIIVFAGKEGKGLQQIHPL